MKVYFDLPDFPSNANAYPLEYADAIGYLFVAVRPDGPDVKIIHSVGYEPTHPKYEEIMSVLDSSVRSIRSKLSE